MLSLLVIAGISLFAVAIVGVFAWNIFYPRFLGRVRATDDVTWVRLGGPPLRWFGYAPTRQFMNYIHSRGYEELGDPTAVVLAKRARFALLTAYAGVGGAVFVFGLSTWLGA